MVLAILPVYYFLANVLLYGWPYGWFESKIPEEHTLRSEWTLGVFDQNYLPADYRQRLAVSHLKDCVCTKEYQPVCGSDQHTYSNICEFKCAQKRQRIQIEHEGECNNEKLKTSSCVCTQIWNPVCANSGITYANRCLLACAQATNSQLHFSYGDECSTEGSNQNGN